MWEVTLSPIRLRKPPRILFQDDLNDVSKDNWLCIQIAVVTSGYAATSLKASMVG